MTLDTQREQRKQTPLAELRFPSLSLANRVKTAFDGRDRSICPTSHTALLPQARSAVPLHRRVGALAHLACDVLGCENKGKKTA